MKPIVFGLVSANSLAGSTTQSLGVWLNALAVVQRPMRIVHVGIGDAVSESSVWTSWSFTKALVIDAEPITSNVINANARPDAVIDVQSHVLADTEGTVDYFVASNPTENGLIDPSLLRMVWPSLTLSHQTQRDATTLDRAAAEMLSVANDAYLEPLWLIVDALPAVRILSGGSQLLEASSLVCVRALAEAGFRGEPVGADLAAIDLCLEARGFERVVYLPSLNPKIGHALYARRPNLDAKSAGEIEALAELAKANQTAEALTSSLKQSSTNLQTLQAKLDATLLERDAAQVKTATLGSQLQEQTKARQAALQEKDTALKEKDIALKEKDTALKEKDTALQEKGTALQENEMALKATEAALQQFAKATQSTEALKASLQQSSTNLQAVQAKLDATLLERDAAQAMSATLGSQLLEQTKAKETALKEKETALKEKGTALQEKDAALKATEAASQQLAKANKSNEELTAALKAKETALETERTQGQQLTAENQELIHRQQLMNEELIKAEGQITLIKDLLLREQGI